LSPKVAAEVFRTLKAINETGVTIVLVEQNVKAALAMAHRGVVLVDGKLRHEGPAASLAADPIVAELYLGAHRPQPAISA
jgi:branched-chain amino acid transport system ATP-binding protein